MKLIGQQKRIHDLLKARGTKGMTSQELRTFTQIVDVPKCISSLKDKGIKIESKPEHLGKSLVKRYWLSDKPKVHYEFNEKTQRYIEIVD